MWEVEKDFRIRLGGNLYVRTPNLIAYKEEPLFRVYRRDADGVLGIDFDVYDAQGAKVAVIRNSKVVHGEAGYAVKREASDHTVVNSSTGEVVAKVSRRAEGAELEVCVDTYLPDRRRLVAGPESTNLGGLTVANFVIEDCDVGLNIG
jgi:hypothetical protein